MDSLDGNVRISKPICCVISSPHVEQIVFSQQRKRHQANIWPHMYITVIRLHKRHTKQKHSRGSISEKSHNMIGNFPIYLMTLVIIARHHNMMQRWIT